MHSPYTEIYCNGKDREEYTKTAVRERKRRLRVSFGKGLWNVALEPERRKLLLKFCESPVSVPD